MIDKNGKFLGKVNLIDLFVVLIVLAIVAVLAWRFLGSSNDTDYTSATTTLTYTVEVENVSPDVYESILAYVPGAQLMASGELLPAYVSDVTAEEQRATTITTEDGILEVSSDSDDLLTLTFTITATVSDTLLNEVGTQEVRIGKTHIVKTQHFELSSGLITGCVWE